MVQGEKKRLMSTLSNMNTDVTTSTMQSEAKTFPVDVEHAGIRLALPIVMVAGGAILYLLLSQIVLPVILDAVLPLVTTDDPSLYVGFVAILLAVLGALGIGWLADKVLKRYWPSGRTLTFNSTALHLNNGKRKKTATASPTADVVIQLDQRINTMAWRFRVQRSTPRAQAGWYMTACQLSQDETEIVIYTFMPPKLFATLSIQGLFIELLPRLSRQKPDQSLRLVSEQRRLAGLEEARLAGGAELRPKDFLALTDLLKPYIPGWRSQPQP